jgi:methionine salvage enolase-phosphatase E1
MSNSNLTNSSVQDHLVPYFNNNCSLLLERIDDEDVYGSFIAIRLHAEDHGLSLQSNNDLISYMIKLTNQQEQLKALKHLQDIVWKEGYERGDLK